MATVPVDAYIKAANAFLAKSDGRDKLLAAIQYAAMVVSAGTAGNALLVQKSVSSARKPLRVMKPVETVLPLVFGPPSSAPLPLQALTKLRILAMAVYFGGDHVVWAGQAGILKDKDLVDNAQKCSLYGWLIGSLCVIADQGTGLVKLEAKAKELTEEAELAAAAAKRTTHAIAIAGSATQAIVALGLLKIVPMQPRTIGAIGVLSSLISCYQLMPAVEKPKQS
ncbi:hypothetical protein CYMTET_9407 [Cymbomonas tetramitiformis]|uniref:Uncharacterized protein n=1 Tax=Cymbomonas tetramitiformis TaxID=36881 RepID=A0AAE0LEW5_9CHLO|nr:hypothetical protein CYMTET_9407 [Cymbomonas tetramitiformis]|eukprot:gene5559-6744_t